MAIEIVGKGVCAPKGFKAGGVHAGIRKNPEKKDLALIYSETLCNAAAVYTQNRTKAAPVYVTDKHMQNKSAKAIVCNSGNANACTANGIEIAEEMCSLVGNSLGISAEEVLVASTGVIGVPMIIDPIANNADKLVEALSDNGSDDCANAIMTTDLTKKEIAYKIEMADGTTGFIGGICKGSGMIHPNMATMLGFVTTDVKITQPLLQKALGQIADETFNMISVDGDTSTNDMLLVLANGLAGNTEISEENSDDYKAFYQALLEVCKYLAIAIAADGEGASKLLESNVSGAKELSMARILAKSVITSSLVKAAMFGADANWGRILCALGYGHADFNPESATVSFVSEGGVVKVCEKGLAVDFDEDLAEKVLKQDKVIIDIVLDEGEFSATAWGCDLTYDYVKINGDYRS